MGAAAEQWVEEQSADESTPVCRLESAGAIDERQAASSNESPDDKQTTAPCWNVLAEELVEFPSRSQRIWMDRTDGSATEASPAANLRGKAYADAWLNQELADLRERRHAALNLQYDRTYEQHSASAGLAWAPDTSVVVGDPGTACRTAASTTRIAAGGATSVRIPPVRRARVVPAPAVQTRTRTALLGPRGLRRLLPGAATLAVLVGSWIGVGALAASANAVTVVRLPGTVPVHGGLLYVAKPGDTLWSIATRVEPGADPRSLVDSLENQLNGNVLLPGDRLVLPR